MEQRVSGTLSRRMGADGRGTMDGSVEDCLSRLPRIRCLLDERIWSASPGLHELVK